MNRPNTAITRRSALQIGAGAAAATALTGVLPAIAGPQPIRLRAAAAVQHLVGGEYPQTPVWAFNGEVPGTLLRVSQGEEIRVRAENGLEEPTTVHWHGLRLPNAMDGVPNVTQAPIQPGDSFDYIFPAVDAGTFWYHPHTRAYEQVARGLYGPLIIDEAKPPKVDRDVVWVLDDWRLTNDASIDDNFDGMMDISHGGRLGNTVTINGKITNEIPVLTNERIRLRLISTANARVFRLKFNGLKPAIIAIDGQPVIPHPPMGERIELAPGQRVDLIIDFYGDPGDEASVTDDYNARAGAFEVTRFVFDPAKRQRDRQLGDGFELAANPVPEPDLGNAKSVLLDLNGGAMGNMESATVNGENKDIRSMVRENGLIWAVNGIAMTPENLSEPLFKMDQGKTYRMGMRNQSAWPHPIHLHGHHVRILQINGQAVPYAPWRDTVMVPARGIAEVAFVADNPGNWMLHCHVLSHQRGGMMGVFQVG